MTVKRRFKALTTKYTGIILEQKKKMLRTEEEHTLESIRDRADLVSSIMAAIPEFKLGKNTARFMSDEEVKGQMITFINVSKI